MNESVKSRRGMGKIALSLFFCVISFTINVENATAQQQHTVVTGTVVDGSGEPLLGVSVQLKSNKQVGTVTNMEGKYSFTLPTQDQTLVFTYLGMNTEELRVVPGRTVYNVTMAPSEHSLGEVTISSGIIERDRVSFTGSVSSYSGEELRQIGNTNLLQSLKAVDPAFLMIDNDLRGSDPNSMGEFQIRGQTSINLNTINDAFSTDPNQPLFILNGVEVSLRRINDLDINRVESINILKDAGSTAIYGSRAANGVVVIETKKPKAGKFEVDYSGDFNLSTPDLSVYNLMNAAEKLEFERLAGRYRANSSNDSGSQADGQLDRAFQEIYNERKLAIERGVDTYWLSVPVQTAFEHAHSVSVRGGSGDRNTNEELAIEIGGKYRNIEGVMKGSIRETFAGNAILTYRNRKLTITNVFDISNFVATNSPYGNFADFANANPYFEKYDANGNLTKYLEQARRTSYQGAIVFVPGFGNEYNPLYNAKLNSKDESTGLDISNSLQAIYDLNEYFRFKLGWDLTIAKNETNKFVSPLNTEFETVERSRKGSYDHSDSNKNAYKLYLAGTYAKIFEEVHSLTVNMRGEIENENYKLYGFSAEGFSNQSTGVPNHAAQYKEGGFPNYSESVYRSASLVGTLNYNFTQRYLFDFSYTIDGATSFGSNKLFKNFWSTGIGWNLHKESFAENWDWTDFFKLRASFGYTGNQNVGSVYSKSIYTYHLISNIFGNGVYLSNLANPDLPWQTSRDFTTGIDFTGMGGRLKLNFDYYQNKIDPQIINLSLAPSVGVSKYSMEMGYMDKHGYEIQASFSPIYNLKDRIIWTLRATAAFTESTYKGFSGGFDEINDNLRDSKYVQRYVNGNHPYDIWAVRSLGIDPATGQEVFLRKKDGKPTFEYNSNDEVVVGSTRPDMEGRIMSNLRYKAFALNLVFRYSFGSDIFNYALYNKVENISRDGLRNNLDKRALYDRWKNPGDISEFKSLSIHESSSRMSSRFVQKNDFIHFESANLSYEITNHPWIRSNLGIKTLRVNVAGSDLYRWETSKTERGIEYPYARKFTLGLNLFF